MTDVDTVRKIAQQWSDAGWGEDCFWEGWPECPSDKTLTPNMILAVLPPAVPDTTPDPVAEAAKVLLDHFKTAYVDAVDIQQMPVEQAPVLDVEYLRALTKDGEADT